MGALSGLADRGVRVDRIYCTQATLPAALCYVLDYLYAKDLHYTCLDRSVALNLVPGQEERTTYRRGSRPTRSGAVASTHIATYTGDADTAIDATRDRLALLAASHLLNCPGAFRHIRDVLYVALGPVRDPFCRWATRCLSGLRARWASRGAAAPKSPGVGDAEQPGRMRGSDLRWFSDWQSNTELLHLLRVDVHHLDEVQHALDVLGLEKEYPRKQLPWLCLEPRWPQRTFLWRGHLFLDLRDTDVDTPFVPGKEDQWLVSTLESDRGPENLGRCYRTQVLQKPMSRTHYYQMWNRGFTSASRWCERGSGSSAQPGSVPPTLGLKAAEDSDTAGEITDSEYEEKHSDYEEKRSDYEEKRPRGAFARRVPARLDAKRPDKARHATRGLVAGPSGLAAVAAAVTAAAMQQDRTAYVQGVHTPTPQEIHAYMQGLHAGAGRQLVEETYPGPWAESVLGPMDHMASMSSVWSPGVPRTRPFPKAEGKGVAKGSE